MKNTTQPTGSMGRRAILVVLAVLLATACDDNLVEPETSGVARTVTKPVDAGASVLAGIVMDASTGEVVAGAKVSIEAGTVTTGPDGRFEFTDLASGFVTLNCAVAGYEDFRQVITVTSGRITHNILLTPQPPLPTVIGEAHGYLMTASVEGFDPAWGLDMTGYRYIAVLAVQRDSLRISQLSGTLEDWWLVRADGTRALIGGAPLKGHIDGAGNFILETDRLEWAMTGRLTESSELSGSWGCCGHISGSFTAVARREL